MYVRLMLKAIIIWALTSVTRSHDRSPEINVFTNVLIYGDV